MQARQEGSDPVADWRNPSGLARHCSGVARHRQQDPAYLEEERCVTHPVLQGAKRQLAGAAQQRAGARSLVHRPVRLFGWRRLRAEPVEG